MAVVGAGFGRVVGDEDDRFGLGAEEVEGLGGVGEARLARPEDACEGREELVGFDTVGRKCAVEVARFGGGRNTIAIEQENLITGNTA